MSREEQILERLAELDLALAERVHAKAMAAEDAGEIDRLGRTYQRIARSVRQSLMAKARVAREREAAARRESLGRLEAGLGRRGFYDVFDDDPPPTVHGPDTRDRIDEVCRAARPYVERERPDFDEADEAQIHGLARELAEYDDFLEVSVAESVDRILEILGYPEVAVAEAAQAGQSDAGGSAPPVPPPEPPAHDSA
ncbi:MAG: hypothetical protein A2790_00600 [Phenylobacterium sp. RIFCSPHIGHO2_01_FULL_69_31]|uniref:hypothetical protein n=1 Tax=Phenylobacterium sp. RIFCSPHIGHO2_01_FULL_69_31 TaxID=1801944 RepID=UPI0008CF26B0|nr:hypothetical protein [Phenylobacterium sp. RIFCSPHIGHO2_01_FULL_69_31]OHB27198.1 MAG: hypothetical protein A2790_00600 [Phenylobacterium sp. RIFCSPHIGHO2_01_FULL_69_31]